MYCAELVTFAALSIGIIQQAWTLEAMYEGFEQLNGTDIIDLQLRVSKINRTTAAIKGTVIVKKTITSDYKFHLTLLHSAKGNQQFNHYPMKIPPTDFCEFTKSVWPEYMPYYEGYVENILRVNECPLEPRVMKVNNHILDGKMFSKFLPKGLWKVIVVIVKEDGSKDKEGGALIWTMRIFEDGYFG